MRKLHSSRSRSSDALRVLFAIGVAAGCAPQTGAPEPDTVGLAADPSALSGEFKTYVADFFDGRPPERYHTLRQANGQELRLNFDSEPSIVNGAHIYIRGETMANQAMHVSQFDLGPALAGRASALEGDSPEVIAAPASDTYAIVLVDLGAGVNLTAAQAQARLTGTGTGNTGSFAQYYSESSYGKYTISPTSTVFGPFPYTMTACANADTSAMATAMDAMLPAGQFNHTILYFNQTSLCAFGGLGEEGSSVRPSKHTWMNGSLSCVVLMQEPGHNLGLMHANQMKCGTSSFSATPATACTITEYANSMSTMGSGCKTLSGYERMYEQWMNGCNAVTVPGSGTFNLMPLENPCGGGIQTLQIPFPAPLVVSDPQAGANTMVNLRNYYLDLRVAAGSFDAYGATRGQGAGITFTGPTVFIYTSDNVRNPTMTTGRNGTVSLTQQSSVWTELLNTTPTGTTFTGLTAAGQSFVDPAGGPTITLMSISATGAVVQVTNPMNTNPPTCLDGTTPPTSGAAMGSTTCGPVTTSDGGVVTGQGGSPGFDAGAGAGGRTGTGGTTGTGGRTGTGGMTGGATGGTTGTGGTTTGTAGTTGTGSGGGGGPIGTGGSGTGAGGKGAGEGPGGVSGGCGCSVPSGNAPAWASLLGTIAVVLLRRRRRGIR
jgi:hypothetical protein